jgi:hypothetical protein
MEKDQDLVSVMRWCEGSGGGVRGVSLLESFDFQFQTSCATQ